MRKLYSLLRPFLEPGPVPILFVIGVIVLELIGNAFYDMSKQRLGAAWAVILGSIGVLVLVVIAYRLFTSLQRSRLIVSGIEPRQALIVLVSQGRLHEIPATVAMRYHYRGEDDERPEPTLKYCWLIASRKPPEEPRQPSGQEEQEPVQSSWKNAYDLKALYQDRLKIVEVKEVDAEDPEDVFQVVEEVYEETKRFRLPMSNVVADFTGGTKLMTAGMVLSCAVPDRDLEYMKPRAYLPSGRADPKAGADPKLVDLSFFVEAFGGGES